MNKRKFIKLSIFGSLLYSIFPYKISLAETKKIINQNLTEAQKKIMFEEATERPFSSPLNQEKRNGFYHLQKHFLELLKRKLITALA